MLKECGILEQIKSYMEIGSTQAIKSTVEAGLGISILPRLTVTRELQQGTLREVQMNGVHLKRNLWLVKKKQRFHKDSVAEFIDLI